MLSTDAAKGDSMAGKAAQSSYKSTPGQPQQPHDDATTLKLDKILQSLGSANYRPSHLIYRENDYDSTDSPVSPVGQIPKPFVNQQPGLGLSAVAV